tara:strand:- start:11643 stop:12848 length:1206 start_codon:yes stop_codon:yes gene_type:complete
MKLTKNDILSLFKANGASRSELDRKSVLFQSVYFQDHLLHVSGVLTDINAPELSKKLNPHSSVQDLSGMDVFDLEDFVQSNQLTLEQANSITPAQLDNLSSKTKSTILDVKSSKLLEEQEIWFSLVEVVQTGLPVSPVEGEQYFERTNGDLTVTFSAPSDLSLPYGQMARKIFIWLVSEAVKSKGSRVTLGKSLKKFVTETLESTWTTGKNGNADAWARMLTSMLGMSITATRKGKLANGKSVEIANLTISKRASLWWSEDYDSELEAYVDFNSGFIDTVRTNAVPGDARAMRGILKEGNCLAFDTYTWLTYRYYKLDVSGLDSTEISLHSLWKQSGSGFSKFGNFKQNYMKALETVSKWYPNAYYKVNDNTLVLFRSTPHVSPKLASAKIKQLADANSPN